MTIIGIEGGLYANEVVADWDILAGECERREEGIYCKLLNGVCMAGLDGCEPLVKREKIENFCDKKEKDL